MVEDGSILKFHDVQLPIFNLPSTALFTTPSLNPLPIHSTSPPTLSTMIKLLLHIANLSTVEDDVEIRFR